MYFSLVCKARPFNNFGFLVLLFWLLLVSFFLPIKAFAAPDEQSIELGEEYEDHARPGSSGVNKQSSRPLWRSVALYIPNRIVDAFDIFRFDVGVGLSFGAVGRVTRYGQFGYRTFSPASLRVGLQGRRSPVFVERQNEFGVGPTFLESEVRDVGAFEVGASVDLLVAGVSAGICFDELADFFLGIFGVDFKDDDF